MSTVKIESHLCGYFSMKSNNKRDDNYVSAVPLFYTTVVYCSYFSLSRASSLIMHACMHVCMNKKGDMHSRA